MRLPTRIMSSSQEQGSTSEVTRNGHSEEQGGNGGQDDNNVTTNGGGDALADAPSTAAPQGGGNNSAGPTDDFSEYLWMENEEEFDQETLKQIEEDYMISHYSDMFENSLLEDGQPGPTTASLCVVSGSFLPPSFSDPHNQPTNSQDDVDDVTRRFNRSMNFASRLNPDAAEFVPKGPSLSNNVSSNH